MSLDDQDIALYEELLELLAGHRMDTCLTAVTSLLCTVLVHARTSVKTDTDDRAAIIEPTRELLRRLESILSCPRQDVQLLANDIFVPHGPLHIGGNPT